MNTAKNTTHLAGLQTLSWEEALGGGRTPERFKSGGVCNGCGQPLSRYNRYTLCALCRRKRRDEALHAVRGTSPDPTRPDPKDRYWCRKLVIFKERTPLLRAR